MVPGLPDCSVRNAATPIFISSSGQRAGFGQHRRSRGYRESPRDIFDLLALTSRSLRKTTKKTSLPRTTEERADETFDLEVELDDYAVGTAGETETGTDVIANAMRQLAPDDGKDVVLLLVQWRRVVEVAGRAIDLDPRR